MKGRRKEGFNTILKVASLPVIARMQIDPEIIKVPKLYNKKNVTYYYPSPHGLSSFSSAPSFHYYPLLTSSFLSSKL